MTSELPLTIAAVVMAIGALLLLVRRYPKRVIHRIVTCPEKGVLAEVGLRRAEVGFGTVGPVDVIACSMFPGSAVECSKRCLH
jgi:hypothetical protein